MCNQKKIMGEHDNINTLRINISQTFHEKQMVILLYSVLVTF